MVVAFHYHSGRSDVLSRCSSREFVGKIAGTHGKREKKISLCELILFCVFSKLVFPPLRCRQVVQMAA